jgi:hypothetical protein
MYTRAIASVVLASFLSACTSWRSRPVAAESLTRSHPTLARLFLADRVIQVRDAVIEGDSLIGRWNSVRIAVATSEVRRLEVNVFDGGKTALLVAGIGVTAIVIIAAGANEPPPSSTPICSGEQCGFSCPLVYSWDGQEWRLDSGTFGGAIMRALARLDVDNLDAAVAQDGIVRLRVANELNETDHLDAVALWAVDHPAGVTVAPDGARRLHALGTLTAPFSARDFSGRDALPRVRAADGWSWESALVQRDTSSVANVRDGIEVAFPKPRDVGVARVVVDGRNTPWAARMLAEFVRAHGHETASWYDSLNANPELARRTGARLAQEAFLSVSVRTPAGWERQGLVWEAGPEIVKRQVAELDLARVTGDTLFVRLESAPSFWLLDRVAVDFSIAPSLGVHEARFASAIDGHGRDVRSLIARPDGRDYTLETGDRAELVFHVPDVPPGMARSYVLRSHGWYQIHTEAVGAPQTALLERVASEPYAISRLAVSRMNDALRALERGTR